MLNYALIGGTEIMSRSVAGASIAALVLLSSAHAADVVAEPVAVYEPNDLYVSLFVGGVWTPEFRGEYFGDYIDVTTDVGYALGIAVGTKVFDALRLEVELSGTSNSMSEVFASWNGVVQDDFDGSVSALYLLGSAWYDIDLGGGITPYLGGGLGVGFVKADFEQWGDWELDGAGLAFQLGAGVQVDVADGIALDLGYRFKAVPGLTVEDHLGSPIDNVDLSSHVLQTGLTFSF